MAYNDNERRLQSMDHFNDGALMPSVVPALALLGLGQAATYLETHPDSLMGALTSDDWALRTAAVQVLGKQGKKATLEPLISALQDRHPSVRAMAARALGMQGERTPRGPLLLALHDPEWRVRTAVVLALGKVPHKTILAPLLVMLHDEQAAVRAATVWALGNLGAQAPIESLVTALQDTAGSVREAAVMALQEQGERAPIAPLLTARWDEERSVREAAYTVFDERLEDQPGQKLEAQSMDRPVSSWLRLAVAVPSVVLLIPLIITLIPRDVYSYSGRADSIGRLIALGIICLAIVVINRIYQGKRFSIWRRQHQERPTSTMPWHGAVLVVTSIIVLVIISSTLLGTGISYVGGGITLEVVHFILACQLIALACVSLTAVVINKVFHTK